MNNHDFDIENQCELSYELLHLLKWLIENESPTLKKLITRAVAHGLREELSSNEQRLDSTAQQTIHNSIVDFLDLLDSLLHETLTEGNLKETLKQNLKPSINKIDSTVFDYATVRCSLEKTSNHLEDYPQANAKEYLYKELLKRWKPRKAKMQN